MRVTEPSRLIFLVLGLLVAVGLRGQDRRPDAAQAPSQASTRTARFDAAVEAAMHEQDLVGVGVAIVIAGDIVHARGYGFADREQQVPVDADKTLFRWASISKPVTAVAALQLVEQGKVTLDTEVRELLPTFPRKPWPITLRQLLCHQGGIVHYENGKVVRTERRYDAEHPFADVQLALDTFQESPLVCEPGTRFSYSTHGYILVGAMVQRAGGAGYWQQVRDRIATPLAMTTFRPDYQWEAIPGRARGYRRVLGAVVPSSDTDVSWKLPGGGFVSNVVDLARFAQGLLRGALLQPQTQAQMFTVQATADGKATGYGLGIGVGRFAGERRLRHTGSQEKTRTDLMLFPERKVAVAVMTNSEHAKLASLAEALASIALEGPAPASGR